MARNQLVSVLDKLRKDRGIKDFSIIVENERVSDTREEVSVSLETNGLGLISLCKGFNPEVAKSGKVTDLLLEEVTQQLIQIGIMSLLSNRTQDGAN